MNLRRFGKLSLLSAAALGVLILAWIFLQKTVLTCSSYECLLFPDKKFWKIQTVYENDSSAWRGILIQSDYLVRLERYSHIPLSDAADLTKIRIMQIQGLFDSARSPYPGVISDRIVCDDSYKPKPKVLTTTSGVEITYFSAFLNDRLQYGTCSDDAISYKGYTALFSCGQTNDWYSLELIIPAKKVASDSVYTGLFSQIGCVHPSVMDRIFPG